MPEGTRLYLLAPIVRGRKGEYRKELPSCSSAGFQRVKVDGKMYEIDEVPALDKKFKHDIEVVVDRHRRRRPSSATGSPIRSRPRSASPTASRSPRTPIPASETIFSAQVRLPGLGLHDPRDRAAAVLVQQPVRRLPGLRRARHEAVLRPRAGGARRRPQPRRGRGQPVVAFVVAVLHADAARASPGTSRQSMHTPWHDLPEKVRQTILYGSRRRADHDDATTTACGSTRPTKPFEGVMPNLERRWRETDSAWVREELGRYQNAKTCEVCDGARLKPEALAVKIAGQQHQRGRPRCRSRRRGDWFAGARRAS